MTPQFGLIIVGDEILSGKRADKHMPKVIALLAARGLQLGWAEYVGDVPDRITAALARAFASGDVVFSTGGIGATINIKTARPLDNPGFRANIGVKGVLDTSNDNLPSSLQGDSVTPEVSGIFSTTSADGRFGISLSGSYQERDFGFSQVSVPNGWRAFRGDENNWGTIPQPGTPGSENITNRPGPDDIYSVPQNLNYSVTGVQRQRTNGQLTLQFAPTDRITTTLDYTYSENKIQQQRNEPYDRNGAWAASGHVLPDLLATLLREPYFSQPSPKSTGRELFNGAWLERHLGEQQANDIQATLLELTATSITSALTPFKPAQVLLCGGGAHNQTLLQRLQTLISDAPVTTTDEAGMPADWVEAAAFAWLAWARLNGVSGNAIAVTGASRPAVLGALYLP